MPEEPIESAELREKLEQLGEEASEKGGWMVQLSLSTALIAVCAAVASLESGAMESSALLSKNEAILAQSKATDQWAYYQAKGMKATLFEVQAEAATSPEVKEKADARFKKYKAEQDEIQKEARKLEDEVKEQDHKGEEFFHHHHRFALAVTVFQVSIALSAIAALTRKKPLWWMSLVVGATGIVYFLKGFGWLGG